MLICQANHGGTISYQNNKSIILTYFDNPDMCVIHNFLKVYTTPK